MHMAWLKTVGGRLESRYRYSNTLVYNNFIFPEPTEKQKKEIEKKAKIILEVRNIFSNHTLADLYDPISMPMELVKAHNELDRAVDRAYRSKKFKNDNERVAYLFNLYLEHEKKNR